MSRRSNAAAGLDPTLPSGEPLDRRRAADRGPLERGGPAADQAPLRRRSDVIIGSSPAMARVLELVAVAARTDIPVLILGESGTGKELVARAVHYTGGRAARPFLTVNCGAVPETLMEDELFGHARGAYTGAQSDKKGVFEEADGGTLFLDEIGDLYPSCQAKLLRVLQEREVRRLGETRSRDVDVRIITATHRDLDREMAERRFRDDLFHRISVLPIRLPPLRERREDVPLLAVHFMERFDRELGRSFRGFTARALERLRQHAWPGNVRELENRVKQAMVMSDTDVIDAEALALEAGGPAAGGAFPSFREAKADFEKAYVVRCLRAARGKVAAAARLARKDRKDFYELMKRHAVDPEDYRE